MADLEIELEEDAIPIVRMLGATLKRTVRDDAYCALARSINGRVALVTSAVWPSLTIGFSAGRVKLQRGIVDPDIQIETDFSGVGQGKPRVTGLWRHPLLASKVTRLLAARGPGWSEAAQGFWDETCHRRDMPGGIRFVCTDEDRDVIVGNETAEIALHGTAEALSSLLNGDSVLTAELFAGRISMEGSVKHLAVIADATTDRLLGETTHA